MWRTQRSLANIYFKQPVPLEDFKNTPPNLQSSSLGTFRVNRQDVRRGLEIRMVANMHADTLCQCSHSHLKFFFFKWIVSAFQPACVNTNQDSNRQSFIGRPVGGQVFFIFSKVSSSSAPMKVDQIKHLKH